MTKAFSLTIVLDNCKGDDREEYTKTAAREREQKLGASFGEGLWNVALEPGCRNVFVKETTKAAVSVHA